MIFLIKLFSSDHKNAAFTGRKGGRIATGCRAVCANENDPAIDKGRCNFRYLIVGLSFHIALFIKRQERVVGNFPEMPVRVGDITTVTAPEYFLR